MTNVTRSTSMASYIEMQLELFFDIQLTDRIHRIHVQTNSLQKRNQFVENDELQVSVYF